MTGKEKRTKDKSHVMPDPDTSSQDATDTILGTDSVTDALQEQVLHERETRAQTARLQEKACREVEDYINSHLT
jgi:hypothetical protein